MLAMGPGYTKSAVGDVSGLYALHKIFRDIAGLSGWQSNSSSLFGYLRQRSYRNALPTFMCEHLAGS